VAFDTNNLKSNEASLVGAADLLSADNDNVQWDLERTKLQSCCICDCCCKVFRSNIGPHIDQRNFNG